MELILETVSPLKELLGKQKYHPEVKYRKMFYTITNKVKDGLLVYNLMTKAMVLLGHDESDFFSKGEGKIEFLVENWFLVPKDFNERKVWRQVFDIASHLQPATKDITRYTIFTTLDCNARCFYCYQKGKPHIPMSKSVALDTVKFIKEHSNGKKVHIQWFGGEPLMNKEIISFISNELDKAEVCYESRMITNGYLMDEKTSVQAKKEWNLKSVQISLDGTQETYNKSKAYVYNETNPYRIVLDNIHSLLEIGINVNIRLNIELYNADNMLDLVRELAKEFKNETGLTIYTHPLCGDTFKNASLNDVDKRKVLLLKEREINDTISSYNLCKKPYLDRKIRISHCMADNDSSVTILPDGHIGKCEHFTDSNFIGHLNNNVFDKTTVDSFKLLAPEIEACKTCAYYPECRKPLKCETAQECFPELQEEQFAKIRRGMLEEYRKYIKS